MRNKAEYGFSIAFLLMLGLWLLYLLSGTTTFPLHFVEGFDKGLLSVMQAVAVVRFLVVNWKNQEVKIASAAGAVLLMLLFLQAYYSTGQLFIHFIAVAVIGCYGMNLQWILRLYTCVMGSLIVTTLVAFFSGAIGQYVYATGTRALRSTWGYAFPTDFASYLLFICLILWAAFEKIPDLICLLLSGCSFAVSLLIARSRTSTLCFAVLIMVLIGRMIAKRSGKSSGKILDTVRIIAFPVLAGISILSVFAFSKGYSPAIKLNRLFSNRLSLGLDGVVNYGIHPFGSAFDQIGAGGTTIANTGYNFVDSSYLLLLLRFGWILLLIYCVIWPIMTKRALKAGQKRLAWVLAIISLHAFMEHHFVELNYNILLAAPFAAILPLHESAPVDDSSGRRKTLLAPGLTAAGLIAIAYAIAPAFLSRTRTFFDAVPARLEYTRTRIWAEMLLLTALIAVVCVSAVLLVKRLVEREGSVARRFRPGLLLVAATLALLFGMNRTAIQARAAADPVVASVEQEKDILKAISDSSGGTVYAATVPEFLREANPKIRCPRLVGEDLARNDLATVIVDRNLDSNVFIQRGFLFAEISDAHAVYTKDEAVIQALKDTGLQPTGYYSAVKTIMPEEIARHYQGELGLTEEGYYWLDYDVRKMNYGPQRELFRDTYLATFYLHTDKEQYKDNAVIAKVYVKANMSAITLAEQTIKPDMFDQNGELTINLPFVSEGYTGVEFLVITEPGGKLDIEKIEYQHTPNTDTHAEVNDKGQKLREEFFDENGNRSTHPDGYAAVEYTYDTAGNRTEFRYLDENDELTLKAQGFAILRREYNERGYIVRESYYGLSDEPVACVYGYASTEYERDEKGNALVQRFYDVNGKPYYLKDCYFEVRREYNALKQVVAEAYFDENGKPATETYGYSSTKFVRDAKGKPIEQTYYDENGNAFYISDEYTEIHREYNAKGQLVREAYFDENGDPVPNKRGVYSTSMERDENGKPIVQRYFNKNGEPFYINKAYTEIHRVYDENGRVVEETYFDEVGKPVANSNGAHRREIEYDSEGQVLTQTLYDLNDNVIEG